MSGPPQDPVILPPGKDPCVST